MTPHFGRRMARVRIVRQFWRDRRLRVFVVLGSEKPEIRGLFVCECVGADSGVADFFACA